MYAVSSIFSFKIVKFRHNISSKKILSFVEYSIDRAFVYLPPANEVCEGYVFTRVCLSTGGIPVCLAGGIPACLAGLQEGGVYPSMPCRFPGPHPVRSLRGLAGGSPDPHPEGCIPACTEADPSPTADGYCFGVHHTGVHSCVHSVHWDMGGWCTKFFACQPFYVLGKVFLNSQTDGIHTKS